MLQQLLQRFVIDIMIPPLRQHGHLQRIAELHRVAACPLLLAQSELWQTATDRAAVQFDPYQASRWTQDQWTHILIELKQPCEHRVQSCVQ